MGFVALDKYDLSSITNITSGAAPLSVALANKCLERLSSRGASAILIQGSFASTHSRIILQILILNRIVALFRMRIDRDDVPCADRGSG